MSRPFVYKTHAFDGTAIISVTIVDTGNATTYT